MTDWIPVKAVIKQGYGVASGKAGDRRFPEGTIAMQKPVFADRGLNLDRYFSGTLNLSIAPYQYRIKKTTYTFKNVKWSPTEPAEDFSFLDCRILQSAGQGSSGLIYYPHPETKPEHFQSPDILEVLTAYISDLSYGDEVILEVDSQQIEIVEF